MTSLFVDDPDLAIGFAGNPLDRLSERRDEPEILASFHRRPDARSFVLVGDVPVLKRTGDALDPFFTPAERDRLGSPRDFALLGQTPEGIFFASLFDEQLASPREEAGKRSLVIPGRDDLALVDLRSLAVQGALDRATLGMLAQAKSLLHWHARHRFCSNCGAPTLLAASGWRRECPACKAHHFPRTDPVVIMLATRGEFCLLGRQARFTPNMYSALAGFVEPGETIEGAVRREIMEEAGVKVGRVTYLASQPWPFPASLMLGCLAEAVSEKITIDLTELEDARWFSRSEVAAMLAGTHPQGLGAPQPIAIARFLLEAWAQG
jgi:NAD+ diphosphatase